MPAASLRALLSQAIDYAGLFPPASLELESALWNYSEYVRGPDAWMLGTFILPVAEFDAAARGNSKFEKAHPLRVSALGPRTDSAHGFIKSLSAAMDSIAAFRVAAGATASVEQFEMLLPADVNTDLLQAIASRAEPQLATFWEAPRGASERVIELIAANNNAKAGRKLGFKLRTGGVRADAFPCSAEIAFALMAAGNQQVPIKFTAGLHHPVRVFHDSVQSRMHGFLNVLGAGALAVEHQWNETEVIRMLDDEDPASFSFTDDCFAWRDWEISTAKIPARRGLVTSLGSCSFDEPRDDLRALKLL
ncbi:MAG TPA: hypothetical protein VLO30_04585 [Chthoniobacterales bacterium]|nr:hypothetical protein [Chthoniobacterales bacterium]